MKKRKYSKWEQRRAEDMYELMEEAENAAKDLKGDYMVASAETESDAIRVAKKFQLSQHLSEKEASRVVRSVDDPENIGKALAQMKKSKRGAEVASEIESPAYKARVKELHEAQQKAGQRTWGLFRKTKDKTAKALEQIAIESFDREAFSVQQQVGEAVPLAISESEIKRLINKKWHGRTFSDSIWKSTEELSDAVKRNMLKSVLTGKGLNRIAKEISEEFGGSYNDARRLVRTEACFVTNQIQLEIFRKAGVKWYIYSAILDERTSEICRGLDGTRHKVKDAKVGVNFPPMHPWCRSSVVPVMPESLIDKLKQKARKFWGKVVRVPLNLRFSEWFRKGKL